MVNKELWKKIEALDFDEGLGDYNFTARLSNENSWPETFTKKVMLEYKKFMYLAAVADKMVSPSPIVDVVWHQHLVFTQHYHSFCELLGKQVQHVPSTHNPKEEELFKQAVERTRLLYESVFGPQPTDVWQGKDIYSSLHLPKSKFKPQTVIQLVIISALVLLFPANYLLWPLFVQIDNPYFLTNLLLATLLIFVGLEWYNRKQVSATLQGFDKASFVYHLSPNDLVYLQQFSLVYLIHGIMHDLLRKEVVMIAEDGKSIQLNETMASQFAAETKEQEIIINRLQEWTSIPYAYFVKLLAHNHTFKRREKAMEAFEKYYLHSRQFILLLVGNLVLLMLPVFLGIERLVIGLERDKNIGLLVLLLIVLVIASTFFIRRLKRMLFTIAIPAMYKHTIVQQSATVPVEWKYFVGGTAIFSAQFLTLTAIADQKFSGGEFSGGGCGSSCGGGCGGGGCGGGCGGCGGGD